MAIIYTYPVKTTPANDDLILISDSADNNKTKQIKVSSLPGGSSSGVSQIIAGTNVTIDPVGGTGSVTINASGGGGTPANPTNSIQFNNAGAFGGSANLTFSTDTLTIKDNVIIQGDGSNDAGKLKLNCYDNSHHIELIGPDHGGGAASYSVKFPATGPGGNQKILQSDASGVLSWINTPSSGGGGSVDSVNTTDGTYINLTPNSATQGAVTVTADLSAVDGTSDTATRFLSKDNTWDVPSYTAAYTLPLATNGVRGGVQIGYTQNGKNYPVQLSSEKAYVNVPWTDNNTTYSAGTGLALNGTTFSLASGAALTNLGGGTGTTFLRKDGSWATPQDFNTNIANSNLQLDNNRTLDFRYDGGDKSLTFINTNGGSKNLFKFEQTTGTAPYFYVGHSESAYEGYIVLEGNGSNRTGQVQFENAAGTYYTSIKAPNTFGANQNIVYVLPNLQGAANSVLTNNGSGTLSWASTTIVEEGTWTPSAYVVAGSAPTLSSAVGSYIKIGDLVNCYFYLNVTSTSSANVPMIIQGLPFSASNTNGYRGSAIISRNDGTNYIQQQATSGLVSGNQLSLKRPDIQATNPSGTTVSITNTETINASWYAQGALNYILEGTIIFKV